MVTQSSEMSGMPAESVSEGRYELPWWSLTWWSIAAAWVVRAMTVVVMMASGIVAGFYFVPVVLRPLVDGPIGPWIRMAQFLWQHGEISLPLIPILVAAFWLEDVRTEILAMLRPVVKWIVVLTITALALYLIGALFYQVALRTAA